MPRSIVVVPTTENLVYATESEALAPTELATVANQDKYLKNVGGVLQWISKNTASGVVELNTLGLIDNGLLPSYVDDVLTYATFSLFPVTGETGKIYVDESNGYSYRWTGSAYYCISTQSFYTKVELDALFNTKLNLSGGTMTGNLVFTNNNISGVTTITGTNAQLTNVKANDGTSSLTISNTSGDVSFNSKNASGINTLTATTGNFTNMSGVTMIGAIQLGSNYIYGLNGAIDVLNFKGTNLRSRDDIIGVTLETGGILTLQQNMNANTKNISSVGTLGATTVNATTTNTTNLSGCTMSGTLNMGANPISSSGSISTSGVIQCANIQCDGYFARTSPSALHFQLIDSDIRLSKSLVFRPDLTETDRTISNLITLNATNVNLTNLSGCNTTGNILLGSNTYIWGPSNNNTIHVQNLKGDNLVSGANTTVATMGSGGIQLSLPLNANNQNILDGGRIEFASLAGGDGTIIATSTSNFLTMSRAINMNSQNMDNLAMLNGVTYKAMKKYTSSTTSNGAGNTVISIYPDTGFSIVSVMVTADLVCRNMQYISVGSNVASYSENVGGGKNVIMTVMCMQD